MVVRRERCAATGYPPLCAMPLALRASAAVAEILQHLLPLENGAVAPGGRLALVKLVVVSMSGANGHDDWPAAEATVLGALLLGAPFAEVARILGPEHFTRHEAKLIFQAIATLAAAGTAADTTTVTAQLTQTDHLQAAGGIAALSALARETPAAKNAAAYARLVRNSADCLRLRQAVQESDGDELLDTVQRVLTARATLEAPPSIELRHIADVVEEHRECEWLKGLHKILECCVIAILAGFRDTLKSFIATHWAMIAAISGESVVILSGEGGGLGRRVEAWMKEFAPAKKLRDLNVLALERPVRLNAIEVMSWLVAVIDAAGISPTLILIDTLSKFTPGMKENAAEEVAAFLHLLSTMLRERYGCTILLVAHAGHGDAKRPRGSSVLMANPDAEFIAERPDSTAMAVTVSRERFKDSAALPALAYRAEVVNLGRLDRYAEPVTSLVLHDAELPPIRPMLSGKNQKALLAELERRAAAPDCVGIWTEGELRQIGRNLGMGASSARDAVIGLRQLGYFTATIGGSRLAHVQAKPAKSAKTGENRRNAEFAAGHRRRKRRESFRTRLFACPFADRFAT
jgi:hypothetical protein